MRAERDGTLAVANGLANGGGIVSGRDTTVTAGRLDGGAAGVLGAGVAVDGTLGSAGDLSVTTTGSLTTAGTLIAAGHIAARGSSVDLTGGKASGANVTLTATTDDVTTRRASVTTPGNLECRSRGQRRSACIHRRNRCRDCGVFPPDRGGQRHASTICECLGSRKNNFFL
jgi:filamentous hemagglutinin